MIRIKYILVLVLIFSCTSNDREFKEILYESDIDQEILLSDDENYSLSGAITRFGKLSENEYLFSDFSHRKFYIYNNVTKKIEVLNDNGSGPGEYRIPSFFYIDESGFIHFSDGSNSKITKVKPSGEFVNQIVHTYGGGARFVFNDSTYYIRSSIGNLLSIVSEEGEVIKELFSLKEIPGGAKFKHIEGGGVQKIGSKIYLMNSIEPKIYVYDTETKRSESFWLKRYMEEYKEFDLENIRTQEFFKSIRSIRINVDLLVVKKGGEEILCFTTMIGNDKYLHVLNDQLQVDKEYKLTEAVMGHDEGVLYQHDVNSNNGIIHIRSTENLK